MACAWAIYILTISRQPVRQVILPVNAEFYLSIVYFAFTLNERPWDRALGLSHTADTCGLHYELIAGCHSTCCSSEVGSLASVIDKKISRSPLGAVHLVHTFFNVLPSQRYTAIFILRQPRCSLHHGSRTTKEKESL